MMRGFAEKGASTVVLPNDFRESTSQFEQFVSALETPRASSEDGEN